MKYKINSASDCLNLHNHIPLEKYENIPPGYFNGTEVFTPNKIKIDEEYFYAPYIPMTKTDSINNEMKQLSFMFEDDELESKTEVPSDTEVPSESNKLKNNIDIYNEVMKSIIKFI